MMRGWRTCLGYNVIARVIQTAPIQHYTGETNETVPKGVGHFAVSLLVSRMNGY